jgi:hypothetical protein
MVYAVYLLYKMVKPLSTPDISALMLFYFYQRILYRDPGNSFPDSKEICGCVNDDWRQYRV